MSENQHLTRSHIPALEAETALERALKGLLAATNDGAKAMEDLLRATAEPDGKGCSLIKFTEAFRRGSIVPDPTKQEWNAISLHLVPAVNALIEEALARSGATREDIRQEMTRRRGDRQ